LIKRKYSNKIIIDIDGPEGNALVILGYARNFAADLGLDPEPIIKKMQSGDYNNLLKVFNKYFPYVILETSQEQILEFFDK